MRTRIVIALLIAAVSSAMAADSTSGPPKGNWAKVQALPIGEQLTIDLKQGETIQGEFLRLQEDSITLAADGKERVYPKSDVSEVRVLHRGSRKKNAAIAGGVLFALGFALGYAAGPYIADMEPSQMSAGERVGAGAVFGAIFGGAGAGIAAAVRPGEKQTAIYRAP